MTRLSLGQTHQNWSSKLIFVLATIGFSVGLGNIWRFPYLAGINGGGALVLIYKLCVVLIGIPIVIAELAIGRCGGKFPAATMGLIAKQQGRSPLWNAAGGLAMLTAFLILSYYCVIGGWTLNYIWLSAGGAFKEARGSDRCNRVLCVACCCCANIIHRIVRGLRFLGRGVRMAAVKNSDRRDPADLDRGLSDRLFPQYRVPLPSPVHAPELCRRKASPRS